LQILPQVVAWISNATHGLIKSSPLAVFPPQSAALINAIYFKGLWSVPFDATLTNTAAPWTLCDGQQATVPLMHVESREAGARAKSAPIAWRYAESDMLQMVLLPYGTPNTDQSYNFSMRIIVPKSGTIDALIASIDEATLFAPVVSTMQGEIYLPRFSLDWGFGQLYPNVVGPLPTFFNGTVSVMSVDHKAVIDIDESGSTAAAVTAVVLANAVLIEPRFTVRADRPFLFSIEHVDIGPLFVGKVASLGGLTPAATAACGVTATTAAPTTTTTTQQTTTQQTTTQTVPPLTKTIVITNILNSSSSRMTLLSALAAAISMVWLL